MVIARLTFPLICLVIWYALVYAFGQWYDSQWQGSGMGSDMGLMAVRRVREHIQERLVGHQQEVCGLKWSPSGNQLASGGNDNLLHIWQQGQERPLHTLTAHQAAVKALAWCPFQSNLLATGGGTADRSIKFWNTHTGALLNSIDTGSQVSVPYTLVLHCLARGTIRSEMIYFRLKELFITKKSVADLRPLRTSVLTDMCGVPGVRAAVEQARAGDPLQPRLQPEPALPLEVPLHDQGRRVLGTPLDLYQPRTFTLVCQSLSYQFV